MKELNAVNKLLLAENGSNMSRFVRMPQVVDKQKFALKDFPLFVRYDIHLQRYGRIAHRARLERKSVRSVPVPQKGIGDYILDSAIPFALKKAVDSLSVLHFVRVELYKPRRMALPCAPSGWTIRKQVLTVIGLRNPLKPLLP